MSTELNGTNAPVPLGPKYSLSAPGLVGTITPAETARDFGSFDALLDQAGLQLDRSFHFAVTDAPKPSGDSDATRDLTSTADDDSAVLRVDCGSDQSALLLVEDESGAGTWVLPSNVPGTRELGGSVEFRIPVRTPSGTRGLKVFKGLANLGKGVLKVFVYPLVDTLLGPIISGCVGHWENTQRPYRVRTFTPDNYAGDPRAVPEMTEAEWKSLSGGRALLFVHGTFSDCGAFRGIPRPTMDELWHRYGGRVFAFNHPTLSKDPLDNAETFLSRLPPGLELDVDIVCHSRGGLVSREIATRGANRGLRVQSIVMVGVPNEGTVLGNADHMTDMIDRFTGIAKFLPASTATTIVDAVIVVLKVLAHALLDDLKGLRAMDPSGPFLKELNRFGMLLPPRLYAIASNYEPKPGTPLFSMARVKDAVLDSVFDTLTNDLVVPCDGVFAQNGAAGFPIEEVDRHVFGPDDGVIHTEYFREPRTHEYLLAWLNAGDTRALADPRVSVPIDELAPILDGYRDAVLRTLRSRDGGRELAARGGPPPLGPADLEALRPHVVDLSEGRFQRSGIFYSTEQDVDAIFQTYLPRWLESRPAGEPARVMLYAHGGLTGEQDGLRLAQRHVEWWKRNGVYPIYFVWETGLFDALRSILESIVRRLPGVGGRGLFDFATDPLVEKGARAIGGVKVWGAMKRNAELCSDGQGGARVFARKLGEFRPAGRELEVHALGHSAGSIFHAHFLPLLLGKGSTTRVRSLHFLAPAIRVDTFKQRVLPLLGAGVDRLTTYAMSRHYEEADTCMNVYNKSLLYLVSNAFEPDEKCPILGLQISIQADPDLQRLFADPNRAEVLWSVTDASSGDRATRSTSHGGFCDDAATLNSVAARVLGVPNAPSPYPPRTGRGLTDWSMDSSWMGTLDSSGVTATLAGGGPLSGPAPDGPTARPGPSRPGPAPPSGSSPAPKRPPAPKPSGAGNRVAVCVGIDAYPGRNRLSGCVSDSESWAKVLEARGFTVQKLNDKEATRRGILDAVAAMIRNARPGDQLVFQYAGHGFTVPDLDGDEESGTEDQTLVPIDFEGGMFLIDDDLRAELEKIGSGVGLTCLMDCCHSASNTRMLMREVGRTRGTPRLLNVSTPEREALNRAHETFRAALAREAQGRGIVTGSRGRAFTTSEMSWISLAACQDNESAFEHDGHGDFTRYGTHILGNCGPITVADFFERVMQEFGDERQQTPHLDCKLTARDGMLFG